MALQNCTIQPLKQFLNNNFYIPNYQREYAWEQTELDDFWQDLESSRQTKDLHFFGQVVVHSDTDSHKKYIIDGQQRTTTSIIFLRALYEEYKKLTKLLDTDSEEFENANDTRSMIGSTLIGKVGGAKENLHLVLGDTDHDYYYNNILKKSPEDVSGTKEKKRSHERLRRAYKFFGDKLAEAVGPNTSVTEKHAILDDYLENFIEHFTILYMEATKLDEAFTIFETLNARGKDLETADLLKNYIFSKSKHEVDKVQKAWNNMVNNLDKADPTKYIRAYWNATGHFSREKMLYREIAKDVVSPKDASDLMKNLADLAPSYHELVFPEEMSSVGNKDLFISLTALKKLKASTFYPIVLAMRLRPDTFNDADIAKVVKQIEIMVFRTFTICGNTANFAETFFSGLAGDIYQQYLNDVDEICRKIVDKTVTDQEFSDSFKIWSASSSAAAKDTVRYILRKIHSYLDNSVEVVLSNNDVHIEHIMPQNTEKWNVSEDVKETYLWRLGNLALLSYQLNEEASNSPFEEKKEFYKDSKILPNHELLTIAEWTPQEIENRQTQFAQYALQIWAR